MTAKTKILLVAENVTLAQVVRLKVLGESLPPDEYEVHFACSSFDPMVFGAENRFVRHELYTLPRAEVFRALKGGRRLYELKTLLRYVEEELALIDRVEPRLIVGDFRLSLSVSAELRGVPWATLINAYWSPYALRDPIPVPDHPIVRFLGEAMTERYFPQAIPRVFSHFAAPVNQLRKRHKLPEIGSLLSVLTHADHTLYPDDPALLPLAHAPSSHRFLGPVQWSPDVPMPELPDATRGDDARPLVYVTLGSSGEVEVLPLVIQALAELPVQALVATAGRATLPPLPPNVRAAEFVPGARVAELARVVVSNGGSTTGYQALAAGKPILGLPSNLDQYLTMQALVSAGVALQVKARAASVAEIRRVLLHLLENTSERAAAERTSKRLARLDSSARFRAWVQNVCRDPSAPARSTRAQLVP
ncbi:MAG: nucleotide disphospho-sugar-binding domain-containing protein [Polyangiaceae bacterium]